jgi:N-dimethylarginine dimethylaminohydrolase
MKLNSHNEWDPLKAVVVGTVENFSPGLEFPVGTSAATRERAGKLIQKAYPKWYLDEVAEDLEGLCAIFRKVGVTVLRPTWTGDTAEFDTPYWSASGYDIYNVRDLHIVFGDTLIASAPSSRFRLFETYAFRDIFYEHFFEEGFKWISAPLPTLKGTYLHEIQRPLSELEATEDSLHRHLSGGLTETFHRLDEDEVIFDAANIIRLGRDVLFLVSSTGNRKAAQWLARTLEPHYTVHITHAYRSSHLDSTILPLSPGVVLLNGARVSEKTCPEVFKGWDKFFFTEVAPLPQAEVDFHRSERAPVYHELRSLNIESSLAHISSPWAGLNVMSIDPQTVLVHDRQTEMIKMLEKKGYTVVPVRMRHCYTMLGGLHCTTLDVVRDSTL